MALVSIRSPSSFFGQAYSDSLVKLLDVKDIREGSRRHSNLGAGSSDERCRGHWLWRWQVYDHATTWMTIQNTGGKIPRPCEI